MVKAYIFDFDGTLADSLDAWKTADRIFFERRGLEMPEDFYAKVSEMNLKQASVYMEREFKLSETPDEIEREFIDLIRYEYEHEIRLKNGAKEYLERLKSSGMKLAVATSNLEELYKACLIQNGVYSLFDAFATTAEAQCLKGSEKVYLLAAEKLGAEPEECVVFEDIYPGARAAVSAGMSCVGVLEERSRDDWDMLKKICCRVIHDYTELL